MDVDMGVDVLYTGPDTRLRSKGKGVEKETEGDTKRETGSEREEG